MSLENENDPVSGTINPETEDNPKPRNKGGRPKGSKNKGGRPKESGIALKQQRRYEVSLNECIREGMHPEIIREYYKTILRGQNPILETRNGVDYVIIDPNPLLPAPTLEQRNAAMRALADRGYGLPAQSVTIDAEFRNKVELQLTGISTEQLAALDMKKLAAVREFFKLPAPSNQDDIQDAEIVSFSETTNDNNPTTE